MAKKTPKPAGETPAAAEAETLELTKPGTPPGEEPAAETPQKPAGETPALRKFSKFKGVK